MKRLTWRIATLTEDCRETASARTLVFDVPGWPGHLAGQHVDVRLTAPDGYTTQRSYSIASARDGNRVELTVQRVEDGEVSPYLTDGQAWVAYRYDHDPITAEHGGPARLLVPHLYLWKSAKWVHGLRLLLEDEPGFWETAGYHNYGDPWREQRYQGD